MFELDYQYITFQIADDFYAVPIQEVKEIAAYCDIHHWPNAPEFIIGVIEKGDMLVPVMDFGIRTGGLAHKATEDSCFVVLNISDQEDSSVLAIAVDKVKGFNSFEKAKDMSKPSMGEDSKNEFIDSIKQLEDTIFYVINTKLLVESGSVHHLKKMIDDVNLRNENNIQAEAEK